MVMTAFSTRSTKEEHHTVVLGIDYNIHGEAQHSCLTLSVLSRAKHPSRSSNTSAKTSHFLDPSLFAKLPIRQVSAGPSCSPSHHQRALPSPASHLSINEISSVMPVSFI